jgi:cysteine desulfuration protein SufE
MKTLTVEELEQELEDLDAKERMQFILELGRELESLPEELKTEENRVRGCTSRAWLAHERRSGNPLRLHFRADGEAQIVRGMIAILLTLVNDKTPAEILALDLDAAFEHLELARHFLNSRSNGLASMVRRVRDAATHEQAAG